MQVDASPAAGAAAGAGAAGAGAGAATDVDALAHQAQRGLRLSPPQGRGPAAAGGEGGLHILPTGLMASLHDYLAAQLPGAHSSALARGAVQGPAARRGPSASRGGSRGFILVRPAECAAAALLPRCVTTLSTAPPAAEGEEEGEEDEGDEEEGEEGEEEEEEEDEGAQSDEGAPAGCGAVAGSGLERALEPVLRAAGAACEAPTRCGPRCCAPPCPPARRLPDRGGRPGWRRTQRGRVTAARRWACVQPVPC